MSGLLSYASPWASDNSDTSSTRKRTPTMSVSKNKTIKKMPNLEETPAESSSSTPQSYNSLNYIQEKNELRNSRVQEIINNITNLKPEDDGNGLAAFAPLPLFSEPKPSSKPEYNPVLIPNSNNGYVKEKTLGNSYFDAYSKNNIPNHLMHPLQNPKRASDVNGLIGGGGGATGQLVDNVYDRMMEKMNKIMYLLEEQQKEPGKHIIEEFILYTFLGVFIIFIVDSFSRSGKYIR
jgi:hypothetical protein